MEGPRYYYKSGKVIVRRVPGDQLRGVGRPEQGQHHGHPARQLERHGQLEPLEPLELTPLLQHCEHYAKYLMCFRIVHAAASWCRYYRKTKKNAIDICDHYNETYETGNFKILLNVESKR